MSQEYSIVSSKDDKVIVVDDDDEEEQQQASTSAASATEEDVSLYFLGSVACQVVGIRYYKGQAHPGEFVTLTREPHNPYDGNAIRVDNLRGEKVGHVKRQQAAALAPLLDDYYYNHGQLNNDVVLQVDATIPYRGNQWNLPLRIEFYANDVNLALQVGRLLQNRGMRLQQSPLAADPTMSSTSLVVQRKTVDWKTQQRELDDMFEEQSKSQLSNLPPLPADIPSSLLVVPLLLPHQVDGIRWLAHVESKTIRPPFYRHAVEKGKTMWLSEITNSTQPSPPNYIAGGILADEMGLGKTIQALGVILANPPEGRNYQSSSSSSTIAGSSKEASMSSSAKAPKFPSKSALSKLEPTVLQRILQNNLQYCRNDAVPTTKSAMVKACLESFQNGTITMEQYRGSTQAPTTTLIVCPVSVISNWVTQIETHCRKDTLKVAVYHGKTREDLLSQLEHIDVLVASYNTVSFDFGGQDSSNSDKNTDKEDGKQPALKKRKTSSSSLLFESRFHRIILDEAHTIRSVKTRTYRACMALQAERKHCLTGTPLTNRAEDVQSLFAFLGVEPLADKDVFRRAVSQPIQAGQEIGMARLRVVMSHVALRRNKTVLKNQLPDKDVQLRLVEFPDSPHKKIHQTLFETAQIAFRATLKGGDAEALKNYMSVLETLLRIRQACCSGVLIPKERLERAEKVLSELEGRDGKSLTADEGRSLLAKLKGTFEDEQGVECAVCLSEMEESIAVILRSCSHVFCQACISRVSAGAHSDCPLCRQPFTAKDMIQKSVASRAAATPCDDSQAVPLSQSMDELGASPKISALLEAIREMKPDEKGVIFSQFTMFLDEIEKHLDANGLRFTRIDGKKTATQRIEAMKAFEADGDDHPTFILCSLHAAGTGINLTRANHVYMVDCWWNSAVDQQAMQRVHRIGQTRNVRIIRFAMKESIEERMMMLQESKAAIAKGSMQKLKPEEMRKARVADLKSLFDLAAE